MPTIEDTKELVRSRFGDTKDRGGDYFFAHCFRVAEYVDDLGATTQIVALLHDIIEDTPTTLEELRELGYSEEVVTAVDLLTHDKKQMTYQEYIQRICDSGNPHAIYTKLADQKDNRDPNRSIMLNRHVRRALRKKYAGVWEKLLEAATRVYHET